MKLLNRSALMLQPRLPYLEWVNSLPQQVTELEQPLTPAELEREGRVYLVDEFDPQADEAVVLEPLALALLENELSAWDELALHWPPALDVELLQCWFEIKPLGLVFDAGEDRLMTAQL